MCVCVWTVCRAECLPVYFGSMCSLYRYRADVLNVGHLLCAALYVLAEEGQCGQLREDVLHESIISQRCLKGMGRACNLGSWAKKYQQGLGLGQRNVNDGRLARGCCWDGC